MGELIRVISTFIVTIAVLFFNNKYNIYFKEEEVEVAVDTLFILGLVYIYLNNTISTKRYYLMVMRLRLKLYKVTYDIKKLAHGIKLSYEYKIKRLSARNGKKNNNRKSKR